MMDFWSGVIASILAAIICGLISWLYRGSKGYLGIRKTLRLIKDINDSGVVNLFSSRKSYIQHKDHGTAAEYISRSKYNLLYVGFWLASGTEVGAIISELEKMLLASKKVCIVFIDPTFDPILNNCAVYLGISAKEIKERVLKSLEKIQEMKESLPEDYKKYLSVKTHRVPLSTSAFLIDVDHEMDCTILLDYKLYGLSRDEGYGIEYKGRDKIITSKIRRSYIMINNDAKEIKP